MKSINKYITKTGHSPVFIFWQRITFVLLLIFTSGFLFSCSDDTGETGGDDPLPEPATYFKAITKTEKYSGTDYIRKLGDLSGTPLPDFDDIEIVVEALEYTTVDPHGNPVTASGIIAYPSTLDFRSVILAEHFTISAGHEAPSKEMITFESLFSLYNYLVISPDYLGFGSTEGVIHPYLHSENTAQVSIDMLFAVREYMETKDRPLQKDIYVTGYSQGGAAALAVQKMAEEKYSEYINILKVIAGGGPYDPTIIFNDYTETNTTSKPCVIPMTIIGMDYADDLQLDYSKIFLEPLLSNYDEWINSKQYTMGGIDQKIGTKTISNFLHPDFFTEESNSEFQKIYASLAKNNLTGWTPKAEIVMVHGSKDEVVPYTCAQKAYDYFLQKNCLIKLTTINSNHSGTSISFYLILLTELI